MYYKERIYILIELDVNNTLYMLCNLLRPPFVIIEYNVISILISLPLCLTISYCCSGHPPS